MIAIVDYGMGNAASVLNMCTRLGIDAIITRDAADIAGATHLVLPGVGHFSRCVESIDQLGLRDMLEQAVIGHRKPILGICMGMQVMTHGSEEGPGRGLGWLPAQTRKITVSSDNHDRPIKIPHMGWSYVDALRSHPVLAALPPDPRFYFVHSYIVECADEHVLLRTSYGGRPFTAAFAASNIIGVQFHLEKSHIFGMRMLESFASWQCGA